MYGCVVVIDVLRVDVCVVMCNGRLPEVDSGGQGDPRGLLLLATGDGVRHAGEKGSVLCVLYARLCCDVLCCAFLCCGALICWLVLSGGDHGAGHGAHR